MRHTRGEWDCAVNTWVPKNCPSLDCLCVAIIVHATCLAGAHLGTQQGGVLVVTVVHEALDTLSEAKMCLCVSWTMCVVSHFESRVPSLEQRGVADAEH
eukprot:1161529-Pelagomonas_calceolata.AAC.6